MSGSAAKVNSEMLSSSQVLAGHLLSISLLVVWHSGPCTFGNLKKAFLADWQVKHHVKTVDAHPSPSGGILILVTASLQVNVWWQLLCCQLGRGMLGMPGALHGRGRTSLRCKAHTGLSLAQTIENRHALASKHQCLGSRSAAVLKPWPLLSSCCPCAWRPVLQSVTVMPSSSLQTEPTGPHLMFSEAFHLVPAGSSFQVTNGEHRGLLAGIWQQH